MKTQLETQEGSGYTPEQVAARKKRICGHDDQVGQQISDGERKAPVLWKRKCEEVDKSE